MHRYFVDRTDETAWLESFAKAIPERSGPGGALLDGPSGIGKTALLKVLESKLPQSVQVYSVRCHPVIGPTSMFGAVIDLYAQIETRRRKFLGGKQIAKGTALSAVAFVGEIVPAFKPMIAAGTHAVRASLDSGSMPFDSLAPFEHAVNLQVAQAIAKRIGNKKPTLITVDDLHCCDQRSFYVFERLLELRGSQPLGIVFARNPGRPEAGDSGLLIANWERDGLIIKRSMGGLPVDAIADLAVEMNLKTPPTLAADLKRQTGGDPIFVVSYLEQWNAANAGRALPENYEQLATEQFHGIAPGDRRLLEYAAVQGFWFDSATMAELTGRPHDEVRDLLHELASPGSLIEADEPPEWSKRPRADHYRFRHQALWRLIYADLRDSQRKDVHERLALATIERLGNEATYEQRLGIAAQLRGAGDLCPGLASEYHLALADTAATELVSLAEAEWLCDRAIDIAEQMPRSDPDRDRHLVRAAMLYLSLTEVRWKGLSRPTGERDTDALAARAEKAAERLGDPALLVRAIMMRGKTLMATEGLEPGLQRLQRAAEEAEKRTDPTALYVAKIEYGRQLSKRNLADGHRQLAEAEAMRHEDAIIRDSADPVLVHARNLGEIQHGVSLFDHGRLGEARDALETAVERLRTERNRAELPIAMNYLAQVRMCLGDFANAADLLGEARKLEADRGGDSGWHAYNTALLAHAKLALGESPEAALELTRAAWAETERTWLLNLVPIVCNLDAQALFEAGHLEAAERRADWNVEETARSGMVRSRIAAHMLLGRIRLARGDERALDSAQHSLDLLDERGPQPALRSEEVYYHAAVVHSAAGKTEEARDLLERARDELRIKAATIPDDASRARFFDAPGLNRAIRDGEGVSE